MTPKVLLVGCGITSAITAKFLQAQFDNINITVWEKLTECGGRFRTIIGGNSVKNSVDLGAQYITTTDETMKSYDEIYSSLFNNNILTLMDIKVKGMKRLSDDKRNYVAPLGMKSVVDHFLRQINFNNICYGHNLTSLDYNLNKWRASTDSGTEELFDVVILTVPVPEIFNLNGDVKSLILSDNHINCLLSAVKYSSRFALGLFFENDVATDCDSEFIDGDPILRFVATDRWKIEGGNKFRSAVIHTTVQFGEKYYKDDTSKVEGVIMKQVEKVFSYWPKPSSIVNYQWKYSQVLQPCESKPGAIILAKQPLLIVGGDGFVGSTFDQCLFSARAISELVSKNIGNCIDSTS